MNGAVETKPHCNVLDCRVQSKTESKPIPKQDQAMDYMAKDYDSFLRAMLDLLPTRVPGWQDKIEADLGMAILELFAYFGDQLSYYQDRVANEAFLRTATQYESVRKLLRLVDYRMHPGMAAQTFLKFNVSNTVYLPTAFQVSTEPKQNQETIVFQTSGARILFLVLNEINLAVAAPSNADKTSITLQIELQDAHLPQGSWIYISDDDHGEWLQVTAPLVVDTILHTTTVTASAPLKYEYPVTAKVNANGVPATHGWPRQEEIESSGDPDQDIMLEYAPLTYIPDTNGEPFTSLAVEVDAEQWSEVEDFLESVASDSHYKISCANDAYITVHFGDGYHGKIPPKGATIRISYRSGIGEPGLVAAQTLTNYEDSSGLITSVVNPQSSFGARDPETMQQAKLLGPGQIRHQNRAVTPADYEQVLQQGVTVGATHFKPLQAKARFEWTGSWTTVVVSLEMPDRQPLSLTPGLRQAFKEALNVKKMAGYDVRLENARYAALHIGLVVHVKPAFFSRLVRKQVERALSSTVFADGSQGFFAPGQFAFGADVYLSDLYAAVMNIDGVQSLSVTRFKRLGDRYPDREQQGLISIPSLLIARCDSDPSHPEHGVIYVKTCGGKEG